ncbi:MAG: hypothetical protein KA788_14025 [Lacunisphaera sp.]|jgi:hypothetical protein|nr:hypothetical protein [Lacunisphaera sp.]
MQISPSLLVLASFAGLAPAFVFAGEPLGYVAPRHSRTIAASPWGIQSGDNERVTLFDRAGELGVKWTRFLAVWPAIESSKDRYDFTSVDEPVDAARAQGITPFVCLSNGNKLYSEAIPHPDRDWRLIYGVKPAPPILNEEAMAAWLRWVDAVVTHAKDRVTHWEIWNEANHYAYWGAKPNAADYGRLVRLTAARIKAIQPEAVIIAGAMAGLDPKFTAGFLAEDTARQVDIVSFHNYASLPEGRIYLADETWAAINAHNPAIQLWQGECGTGSASSTKDFRGTSPWGEMVQAKWLLRQAFIDTFYMRATLSVYFKLFDGGDRDAQQARPELKPVDRILGFPAEGTGRRVRGVGVNEKCLLSNPDLTPKPAFYAYQNLCAVYGAGYAPLAVAQRPELTPTAEGQFQGILHDDAYPSVPLTAAFQGKDGATLVAWWLPWQPQEYTPRPATASLRVKNATFSEPVLVNLLDGSVHAVSAARDGADTVFAAVPLFDFPLVIVERAEIALSAQASTPAHEAIPSL